MNLEPGLEYKISFLALNETGDTLTDGRTDYATAFTASARTPVVTDRNDYKAKNITVTPEPGNLRIAWDSTRHADIKKWKVVVTNIQNSAEQILSTAPQAQDRHSVSVQIIPGKRYGVKISSLGAADLTLETVNAPGTNYCDESQFYKAVDIGGTSHQGAHLDITWKNPNEDNKYTDIVKWIVHIEPQHVSGPRPQKAEVANIPEAGHSFTKRLTVPAAGVRYKVKLEADVSGGSPVFTDTGFEIQST